MANDLSWRAEEACLNAWPSLRTLAVGRYLLRASGGHSRRVNSVNPLKSQRFPVEEMVEEARRAYGAIGQPVIVRAPDIAAGFDAALIGAGFGPPEAETRVLHAGLGSFRTPPSSVALTVRPSRAWREARARANGAGPESRRIEEAMLDLLLGPVRFAAVKEGGEILALAYGAISRGLLVVESVSTREDARGRGLGESVVAALMNWAANQGVREACLQVMAENRGAVRLYQRLGFARELHRYHYRRGPTGAKAPLEGMVAQEHRE